MSRYGIVEGSYWHDTPGPMGRSMEDCAIVLDIMAGLDPRDNLTAESVGRIPDKGYAAEIVDKKALEGMKLGLPWDNYWAKNGVSDSPRVLDLQ
jgi:amidase